MDAETLYIPVFDSEEVIAVTITPQHAPDPEEVLECLKAEEASLAMWLDFVKAYLAAGHTQHAERMLVEGTSTEVETHFNGMDDPEARQVPQRVRLLCAAAAYWTANGRAQADRGRRNEAFAKAGGLLNQARALDHKEQMSFMGTAQLALAKGDADAALREYKKAESCLVDGRRNVAPLLGMAALHYNARRHAAALAMYRRALKDFPSAPAEVRLGLGAAAFKLGRLDTARAAFRRALALRPDCAPALVGLAVLALHGPPSANRLTEALQLLCQAYDLAPGDPVVLNLLAHHCLLRGDHAKVTALANAALAAADSPAVRCDTETLLARAAHARGNLNDAYAHYRQALRLDDKQPLPRFGLAQISLLQGELTNAISLLEASLASAPAWPDALNVLGSLYPQVPGKRSGAVPQFREAAAKPTASGEVWHMLGELLSPSDPVGALKAYDKAVEVHRRAAARERKKSQANGVPDGAAAPPPPGGAPLKLLNNAAVLHLRAGDLATALPLMEEAVQVAADGATAARLTVGFNMARMREAAGDLQAARREYQGMLENFPEYTDCLLRLAAIAVRCGKRLEAVRHLRTALKGKPNDADALAFLGQLHMEGKEYTEAGEAFETLVELPDHKHDAFARLGLATLLFYSVPAEHPKSTEEARAKRRNRLVQAMRAYTEILSRVPGNVYAANGVGAVLAEQGNLAAAREVFTEVQEAAAAEGLLRLPDVWANAGAAALGLQDTSAAVQQFGTALRRFHGGRDAKLLWWLARAYYDADNLDAARKLLLKALHLAPTQHLLRFNIAATMQQAAVRALRRERPAGDTAKLDDFERAAMDLQAAHATFSHLKRMPPARSGLETRKLDAHLSFCTDTYKKAEAYVAEAKREQAIKDAQRKEQELRVQAAAAVKSAEATRAAASQAAAVREREARAGAARAKLERVKAGWKENQSLQAAVTAGDSGAVSKKKEKQEVEMEALFGEESGDEDYDPSAPDPAFGDAPGDASGGSGGEDEEPEYASEGGEDEDRQALTDAGLLTDDEGGSDGAATAAKKPKKKRKKDAKGGGEKEGKRGTKKPAPSPGGRLKRHRPPAGEDGGQVDAVAALEDAAALEDDAAGIEDADDADAGPSKRARVASLFDDSDEDEAAAPPQDLDDPDAGEDTAVGDVLEDASGAGDGAEIADAPGMDDLFGSDEEG